MTDSDLDIRRVARFLGENTFLGALPDEALITLTRRGHIRTFAKGAVIYRRGEPGNSLMVVLSGRIKIANVSPEGREVVLNFLRAGDLSGEIAVLDGKERTADAVALEKARALVISGRDLLPILTTYPNALLEITKILCEKLRAASAIVEDSTREMRARAARGLLRLAERHGTVSNHAIRLDLLLSQQDLGSYLGISRENVSRQLRQLRFANVMHLEEGHIVITDRVGLAEIAADVPID
jgi:CRP/FNR family transcriptional regulator, cyclic AMP receptor protein